MNLIFVRHGQSVWNLENKFTGWVDVGLSENGVKEASNAGDLLINEKFIPDICFTSFLKRSIDTADIFGSDQIGIHVACVGPVSYTHLTLPTSDLV